MKKEVPYLRLIESRPLSDSFYPRTAITLQEGAEQLSLPYLEPSTIVLANVDDVGTSQFIEILQSIKPKWIVDARVAPRFDTIAGTRSHAFRMFQWLHANYFDLFGQLGLASYRTANTNPEFWGEPMFRMIRASNTPHGPFLILFESRELIEASKAILVGKFNSVFDKRIVPTIIECGQYTVGAKHAGW
jgi:hypothetical protein